MTLVAALGLGPPASGQTGQAVEDRLLAAVDGYEAVPEGGEVLQSSGPITGAELAEATGTSPEDVPADLSGYFRLFQASNGGVAWAIGVEVSGSEVEEFIGGFTEAGDVQGRAFDLLPDAADPLDRLTAYEVPNMVSGTHSVTTAFGSEDVGVVLGVGAAGGEGSTHTTAVLRDMVRAQVDLTPPTVVAASGGGGEGDEGSDPGRTVGLVIGRLLGVGLLIGVVILVVRAVGRRRRPPGPPGPPAGWPAAPHLRPPPPPGPPGPPSEPAGGVDAAPPAGSRSWDAP